MKVFSNEQIDVVCAIIFAFKHPDRVLVGKRKDCGLWEFPGGKVEDDETFEEALTRELKEELDLDIRDFNFLYSEVKDIRDKAIRLYTYVTRLDWSNIGTPQANEHSELKWITKEEIDSLDWIESKEALDQLKNVMVGMYGMRVYDNMHKMRNGAI